MTPLERYVRQFMRLTRAPGAVWTEVTRNRAPHKPLLLLSILDLVERGTLVSPVIDIEENLVDLNELFTNYWRRVIPLSQESTISLPFARLHNERPERFWKLIPVPGKRITPDTINGIESVGKLRGSVIAAQIDDDLFALMTNPKARNTLREALFEAHFSPKAAKALKEQALVNSQSWGYAEQLELSAKEPLVEKIVEERMVKEPVRDQGFRMVVVRTYDHRCALCGVRVLTSEGHTCVDAAHIVPWNESHNDDIRNGMALCKLCHWAFDNRMAAVTQDYTVLVSRQVNAHPNAAGPLLLIQGKPLNGPGDRSLWPWLPYLAKHQKDCFAG